MQPRNHTALEIVCRVSGENYHTCQSNPDNLQNKVPVSLRAYPNITYSTSTSINGHKCKSAARSHLEIQKLQNMA